MKILLFSLLALLLAACNLTPEAASVITSVPAETSNTSASPAPGSDLTQTHTDTVLGIQFNYPAGWIIADGNKEGDLIQLYSPTALTPQPGRVDVTPDMTKIEFMRLTPQNPYSTVEQFIEFHKQPGGASGSMVAEVNRMTLGGDLPAARLLSRGGMAGDVPIVVFEVGEELVSIAGYGDASRFDEIVGTIRRTE
jgi:hypothetical protein